jgi:hypothetical protein
MMTRVATAKMWAMATATSVADVEGVRAQHPTTSMAITMAMTTTTMLMTMTTTMTTMTIMTTAVAASQ